MSSGRDYLSDGARETLQRYEHSQDPPTREERLAAAFRPDDFNARLAKMDVAERETMLEKLGPRARLSYGHFIETRDAARKLGRDVGR